MCIPQEIDFLKYFIAGFSFLGISWKYGTACSSRSDCLMVHIGWINYQYQIIFKSNTACSGEVKNYLCTSLELKQKLGVRKLKKWNTEMNKKGVWRSGLNWESNGPTYRISMVHTLRNLVFYARSMSKNRGNKNPQECVWMEINFSLLEMQNDTVSQTPSHLPFGVMAQEYV